MRIAVLGAGAWGSALAISLSGAHEVRLWTRRPGMARRAARCSMGWCVGPSSPTPMLSCVKTYTTGSSISAARRIDGRM